MLRKRHSHSQHTFTLYYKHVISISKKGGSYRLCVVYSLGVRLLLIFVWVPLLVLLTI